MHSVYVQRFSHSFFNDMRIGFVKHKKEKRAMTLLQFLTQKFREQIQS